MPAEDADAEALVRGFFARWEGGMDAIFAAMRETMAADCVWGNTGFPDCTGPDESIALLRQLRDAVGVQGIHGELTTVVVQSPHVVTERIDRLTDAAGELIAAMPVLGILRVEGGKITAWREYADASAMAEQMAATAI